MPCNPRDSKLYGAGWFCDWIKVTNTATQQIWDLQVQQWFDKSEGDGRKRPFKPSSSKRQQLTAEEATEVSARQPCPRPCCGPT